MKMVKKLKTNTGASLGISLLLFLVCAVLGSVILTAGTTTLGRIYSMSDMDQRYYSVTSAAELLTKELTGKTVTITRTSVSVDGGEAEYSTKIHNEPLISDQAHTLVLDDLSFLTSRAVRLMFGEEKCNTAAAMNASFAENLYLTRMNAKEEEIAFEINHGDIEELLVTGTCTMKKDGTLTIVLNDSSGGYTLVLTLTPQFDEQTSASESVDYSTGTAVKTKTVTKTSKVEWEVGGITKKFTTVTEGGETGE